MHKKTRETAKSTDNGHPERAFFQKFETFGLGQTNWAEILGGILAISSQTIGTILALWVPCSWESVAGSFSYKKRWFLGLKHTTPKYSQNKILAVKNLEKSLRTSVFGAKRCRWNPPQFQLGIIIPPEFLHTFSIIIGRSVSSFLTTLRPFVHCITVIGRLNGYSYWVLFYYSIKDNVKNTM